MSRTYNGVPFRQIWLPKEKYSIKAPFAMIWKKLTLHETDNMMDAEREIRYMISNTNQTSYHIAADENEIIQAIPFNRNAWHSGDGLNGYGNRNTIGWEMCRNYDRNRQTTQLLEPLSSQYKRTVQNTIKGAAQLFINEGRVANNDNIKTHFDWSGKHCPRKARNDGQVLIIKAGIINEYNRLKGIKTKPVKAQTSKKADGHLTLKQVVDKAIAGGYGNYPARVANIKNKTNYTYDQVQPEINKRFNQTTPKLVSKPKAKPAEGTLHLPSSAKTWRVYKPNGPYTVGNEVHLLTPSAYGGIDYEIKGNPAKDVYLIDTGVKGRVAIYAGAETGAKITNNKAPVAKPAPKAKRLYLPASAKLWKIYHPKGPYTSGSEIHNLTPSAYGGLDYEIKGNPAPHVYLIDTGVKGRVAIYAHPSTGATIK